MGATVLTTCGVFQYRRLGDHAVAVTFIPTQGTGLYPQSTSLSPAKAKAHYREKISKARQLGLA